MPTGYTEILDRKPDTTFEQFALRCARAFGALAHMRDEKMDAALPESIEPSKTYHKRMVDAKKKLAELEAMDESDREAHGWCIIERNNQSYEKNQREYERTKAAYDRIRQEVVAWNAPDGLAKLKLFMLEQLQTGKPFMYSKPDKREPVDAWRADLKEAKRNVEYYTEEWTKEKDRAAERNEWLQALRESLGLNVAA